MTYLLDNGHGKETPGKRSPDGALLEWEYNRDIARRIGRLMTARGIPWEMLVPEDEDIPLRERVRRANEYWRRNRDCALISVHVNASGCTAEWRKPHGWSVFVSQNASQASRQLATQLALNAEWRLGSIRKPMPNQPYWTQSLAMCRDTLCPAVLVENLFMDNKADCRFLLSEEGRNTIAEICCPNS